MAVLLTIFLGILMVAMFAAGVLCFVISIGFKDKVIDFVFFATGFLSILFSIIIFIALIS